MYAKATENHLRKLDPNLSSKKCEMNQIFYHKHIKIKVIKGKHGRFKNIF